MAQDNPQTAPTFGVLQALKAGFDLTTKHWWLLLLPILLDSFLWVGVRLRIAQPIRDFYTSVLAQVPANTSILPPDGLEQFYSILDQTNLFTMLSVPVLGIPILMGGGSLEKVPLIPNEVMLAPIGRIIQTGFFLLIFGLLLSGFYYALIAQALAEDRSWNTFFFKLPKHIGRMIILGFLVYLLLLLIIFPLIFGASIVGLINLSIASLFIIGGSVFVMWAIIFSSFSAQAMLLEHLSPLAALKRSFQFVKANLNRTLPLLLVVLFANSLLNSLWLLADNGTWLTFISIVGHAFIATSFIAATFIFFKEHALTPVRA